MFKKISLIYISLVVLLTLCISCNINGIDCPPFDDHFKVTNFEARIGKVHKIDSSFISLTSIREDTISYLDVAIDMFPVKEYYSLNSYKKDIFNFISPAYGCSPPPQTSEETITDIQIFSNKAYNSKYSSEDNLAEIVDIFVYHRHLGYHRYGLKSFIEDSNTVPDRIIFLLNSAPTSAETFQFTIKYHQDGIDLDEYNFTTNPITITN